MLNSLIQDRIVQGGAEDAQEQRQDTMIRPKTFSDYTGQKDTCDQLKIFIQAAKAREESLDHVLISGPPGLGKTTLSQIIAQELGVNCRHTAGPVLSKGGDLAAILSSLSPNDVLFIDEIHRLPAPVEEILYPAMEDQVLDLMIGEGAGARSVRLDLPPFTLVGATTRSGLLSAPLRDRFGIQARLIFYTPEELQTIIQRSAGLLQTHIDADGALEIGRRSRGTARIANRLLRRIRDFAQIQFDNKITKTVADQALTQLGVDQAGFDALDRHFLQLLIKQFNGGPVGIDTLSAALNEQRDTLESVLEPYLIQQGFLIRTPRGRMVTDATYAHFGLPKKTDS